MALAGVLAMKPDVLLLDEPTAGLDPRARRRLIALLRSFTHTRLVATHDLDLVLDACTRVLVMHEGAVQADGRGGIFADAALLERFADAALLERWRPLHLEPPLGGIRAPGRSPSSRRLS